MVSAMQKVLIGVCLVSTAGGTSCWAATYAELLGKSKAALAQAEASGKRPAVVKGPDKPYAPTAADRERGYVVYVPPMAEEFSGRQPVGAEVRQSIEIEAARGGVESFLLGVRALAPLRGPIDLVAVGLVPDGIRVEALPVVMAPVTEKKSQDYRMVGLWLGQSGPVSVASERPPAWLVRIHVGREVNPGKYRINIGLGDDVTVAVHLKVLPFELVDPWRRGYVFGAFCAGADFSEAQFRQMKEHGIESIQWFWGHHGLEVINEDGKLRMDFAELDRTVSRMTKAGLRGPIVLALGNDCAGHFERGICEAFDLPMQPRVERDGKVVKMAVLDEPRIEELMVEALRQLFEHAERAGWPEIVILPYDEPTERLMKEHRRMVGLLKGHFPKVRLYGVTMNRLAWAQMVLDTDILVSNGDFARILELARKHKKSAWFYSGATSASGYAGCRWRYGLRPYVYGPDGAWFWSYNYYVDDPWNDFDGHTPDSAWVICWPPLRAGGRSVETLAYEGMRAAVDDVRYAMTLEARLDKVVGPVAEKVRTKYQQWRAELRGACPSSERIVGLRNQLIEWLVALEPAKSSSVSPASGGG